MSDKPKGYGGLFKQSDGIVILGKRGSGKSTIVKFIIKILSDPESNFRFTILDIVGNLEEFEKRTNTEYYLVDPNDKKSVDSIVDMAIREGNQMVVLDEADRYRFYETSKLSELVNIGRNYNVGYMITGRRTANVHKDFLVNANWAIIFKHTWPADIERITEWLNVSEEALRSLQPHEFLLIHETDVIGKYRLTLPQEMTVQNVAPEQQPAVAEPAQNPVEEKEKPQENPTLEQNMERQGAQPQQKNELKWPQSEVGITN